MEKLRRKCDWVGRYVKLLQPVTNGAGAIFPVGEVMLVVRNWGGLHLEAIKQCTCVKCRRECHERVKGVREFKVELLPVDYKPTP